MADACIVLFSGGTDSCASAYLACEKFSTIHLLTFFERATRNSPLPTENARKLREAFPQKTIRHYSVDVDSVVRYLSYENYFKNLFRYHYFLLATPGFSSLSWHAYAIFFARRMGVETVFDGMTRELQHLPGHMPEIREIFVGLYRKFNIGFSSPVYDWDVPRDRQFIDQYIVNRHNRFDATAGDETRLTTGEFLFEKKFFDSQNVKGTQLDFEMQHECYPYIVYNLFLFALAPVLMRRESVVQKLRDMFLEKADKIEALWPLMSESHMKEVV